MNIISEDNRMECTGRLNLSKIGNTGIEDPYRAFIESTLIEYERKIIGLRE